MRLLFFTTSFAGGGAEKSLLTIADALSQRGHKVTVAANLNNPAYELPDNVEFIEKDSFQLKKSGAWYLIHRKLYNRIRLYLTTKRIITRVKPDVIITFLHANMQQIIQAHGSIPIISSERNTFDRKLYATEYREKFFLNRKYDIVTVLTKYDKEFIGNRLNNVVVMPNALSSTIITPEEYQNSFSKRRNLLACGRISAIGEDGKLVKGFDLLINAFSKIADLFPDTDLDIAGDGTEEGLHYLTDLANQKGVGKRVHFLGFVKNVEELMKSHQLFILSSRAEGFGRVVIESMAVGTPVVAFKCSGPSEIIEDGTDGFLVEKENINELAEKMSLVLSEKEVRYSFGLNSLKNVERFTMDKIILMWEDLFKQVLLNNEYR